MAWRGWVGRRRLGGQEALGNGGDAIRPEDEEQRQRGIEGEMKQHDFARVVEAQRTDPAIEMRQKRNGNDAADQLEQEIAERDAARLRRRAQCREHAQETAAEIRPQHQAESDGERNHVQ